MFLHTIGHTTLNKMIAEKFQHSKETVSRQFNRVLKEVCRVGTQIIQPLNMDATPPEIMRNPNYHPWIDGTHISAWASASKQVSYRGTKVEVTQNSMCTCSFDMLFTYVYTRWEGTANDSRVLMDAISREENIST
ncbi:uncharacterized protein LOC117625562 [Prunus dulcis]|uniref:uncharacterized protein LOC117625562 n=1 Tax=Prunus dulcis TaxID=3755 RepID=UPI0014827E67|nr:uncharacterized protein LOC117625562 [Prunus dulcis]